MSSPSVYWLNGHLVPEDQAHLPLRDHGLLYGDGVFEGIRFYRRRAFRLGAHLRRLEDSARAIALLLPLPRENLEAAVAQVVAASAVDDGYLRLVVTRGSGPLGLDPSRCTTPNVFIIAEPLALLSATAYRDGVRLICAATRRLGSDGLDPRIKSLNYLNNILAKLEARNAGADEAVLLNGRGMVAEGTAENLFVVRDGRLATPPVSDGALDGVTRALVLELAAEQGVPCELRSLAPYDLYNADECFLSGTGAELMPVREVDGRCLHHCPGPVFRRLQTAFRAAVVDCT